MAYLWSDPDRVAPPCMDRECRRAGTRVQRDASGDFASRCGAMKIPIGAVCIALAATVLAWSADPALAEPQAQPAAPAVDPWTVTGATDVRYFSWKSDLGYPTRVAGGAGGSGSELYIPFALQTAGRLPNRDFNVELVARGGYVWARQSSGPLSGEVSTVTDTTTSAAVTYLGWQAIQPFASVVTNLPTGRSALYGSAANARMDPDLVDIANFGEGFNIGPSVGVNIAVTGSLLLTVSAGYTWRGPFDRENGLDATDPNIQSPARINPGDVFTVTAGASYKSGMWVATLNGSVSTETATDENGENLYKTGTRYLANAGLTYTWPDTGVTSFSASASHTDRNKVLFTGTPVLIGEIMNTNSNLYRVGLQHLFPVVQDKLYIGPLGSYLFRDHNGYEPTTLQFVPEKERWSTGALLRYGASPNVVWNARVEHVWTREDADPAPGSQRFSVLANAFVPGSAVPVVSSDGWQFVGGVNVRF